MKSLFGRMGLTALAAAALSGLPVALLLTIDAPIEYKAPAIARYLVLALAGNFLIGLPLAYWVFVALRDNPDFGMGSVIIIANAIAVIGLLLLIMIGGAFAAVFLGIPVIIAANAFALVGWFLVFKPYRVAG